MNQKEDSHCYSGDCTRTQAMNQSLPAATYYLRKASSAQQNEVAYSLGCHVICTIITKTTTKDTKAKTTKIDIAGKVDGVFIDPNGAGRRRWVYCIQPIDKCKNKFYSREEHIRWGIGTKVELRHDKTAVAVLDGDKMAVPDCRLGEITGSMPCVSKYSDNGSPLEGEITTIYSVKLSGTHKTVRSVLPRPRLPEPGPLPHTEQEESKEVESKDVKLTKVTDELGQLELVSQHYFTSMKRERNMLPCHSKNDNQAKTITSGTGPPVKHEACISATTTEASNQTNTNYSKVRLRNAKILSGMELFLGDYSRDHFNDVNANQLSSTQNHVSCDTTGWTAPRKKAKTVAMRDHETSVQQSVAYSGSLERPVTQLRRKGNRYGASLLFQPRFQNIVFGARHDVAAALRLLRKEYCGRYRELQRYCLFGYLCGRPCPSTSRRAKHCDHCRNPRALTEQETNQLEHLLGPVTSSNGPIISRTWRQYR